ncbi:hypothetical protein S7711_11503 [Stachybotrys chartarum IBT 7711]|uniref:2EXR domain-containing protein n=1 Tax=Stachybotrys chartarum (strain CBS 109288 / IBT 7711) TaxID=1280523 RepID=A0A084AU57_STACB|nr:hypothetical protein S7711_11503 [Stachybotrys chartarum IBT 7711]
MTLQSLPAETRLMIWGLSLPEDVPEVCIGWPTYLWGSQQLQEPYLVDTAFPVLMHICHETRQFVLSPPSRYSQFVPRFRFSKEAGCKVPYRHFRPELDIFYITNWQYSNVLKIHAFNHETIRQSIHLAVEMALWGATSYWFNDFIFKHMQNIKTVSIVFPSSDSKRYSFDQNVFQPPARRSRLVALKQPKKVMGTALMPSSTRGLLSPGNPSVQDWIDFRWEGAVEGADIRWAHLRNQVIYQGSAWDRESLTFVGVTRAAFTFEQFKRGDEGEETWDEVCRDRLHPQDYQPERVEMTRDPTEWRVNDDESWPPENQ